MKAYRFWKVVNGSGGMYETIKLYEDDIDFPSTETLEYDSEEWASSDGNGMNRGYSYYFEELDIEKDLVAKEKVIKYISNKLARITTELNKYNNFYNCVN